MTRSTSRYLPAARFLFVTGMAMAVTLLFANVASAADANTLESVKSDKEQKNNYNAVIATIGPMLGLVGTVYGMIQSFSVLATAGTQVNPSRLADGISHALVVTLFGVGISVPA